MRVVLEIAEDESPTATATATFLWEGAESPYRLNLWREDNWKIEDIIDTDDPNPVMHWSRLDSYVVALKAWKELVCDTLDDMIGEIVSDLEGNHPEGQG